jgi:hypothetical protein
MSDNRSTWDELLTDYNKFLHTKGLALEKHRPYLVRRVRKLILFAQGHVGYFAMELGSRWT